MSNYIITQYSYDKAKKLNLIIKSSKNKGKKIDVYTINNEFLHSIGDIRYNDYPSYLSTSTYNKQYADERKRLYHIRHQKGINIINSKQYLSANLLW